MPRKLWEYYYAKHFIKKVQKQPVIDVTPRGKRRRPYCTKCGKKIRNWTKVAYKDGKPYHKACLEVQGEVRVAKKKLKYPCGICNKPILKGDEYIKAHGKEIRYAHTKCIKGADA